MEAADGRRRRSHSDAMPGRAASDLVHPDDEETFVGSMGGAQASLARRAERQDEPHPAPAGPGLLPTPETVSALTQRVRDPMAAVDSAVVADVISQVHRDRLRRVRRCPSAVGDQPQPAASGPGVAAGLGSSPEHRQLAFTRVFGQVRSGSDHEGLPVSGVVTPPPPEAVRAGRVASVSLSAEAAAAAVAGAAPPPPAQLNGAGTNGAPQRGEVASAVDVRTVSLLEVSRRIRVPLGCLVGALALSDDRREVRTREESPSVAGNASASSPASWRGAPEGEPLMGSGRTLSGGAAGGSDLDRQNSVVMDINFNEEVPAPTGSAAEEEDHDDSVSQPGRRLQVTRKMSQQHLGSVPKAQAFGLVLSPGGVATSDHKREMRAGTARDGFDEWRRGVRAPIDNLPNDAQVTVEVPEGPRRHLSHEAYIVRDPSIPKGQPPQFVFAVATLPEDVQRAADYGRLCRLPAEVEAVTLYCEVNAADDPDAPPAVLLSAQLAQPTWAWMVLLFAVGSLSCVHATLGRLVPLADKESLVGLWWATAEVLAFAFVFITTCTTRQWTSAEVMVFDAGYGPRLGRYWYLLVILGLGAAGGAVQALWVQSYAAHNHDAGPDPERGAPAQAFALHCAHPLLIIAYRAARQQRVYIGEALGVVAVLVGMGLVALKPNDWDSSWGPADAYAAASSVGVAAWIIAAKVVAAQAPVGAILLVASVSGFVITLVVATSAGIHGFSGSGGAFGWAGGGEEARWWLGLLFLSAASKIAFVHALRYLHSIAVSVAHCVALMLAVLWCENIFDVEVPGSINPAWAVPGMLLTAFGASVAAYTTSVRRQHVEVEVLPSNQGLPLAKRARPTNRLTPSALLQKQRQEHGGRTLYHDANRGLRAVPPVPRQPPRAAAPPPPRPPRPA
eukprot:TRINITY_DN11317_c0_g1_i2.p1 TRINITY_DN11317_c0_g1~~TRINITY_DN11317_c0_g1_i2.p1  ORF type:complete len:931 (+),score=220.28 TRINITY_DN11317_c0_g1_i2:96-2795(+)